MMKQNLTFTITISNTRGGNVILHDEKAELGDCIQLFHTFHSYSDISVKVIANKDNKEIDPYYLYLTYLLISNRLK